MHVICNDISRDNDDMSNNKEIIILKYINKLA